MSNATWAGTVVVAPLNSPPYIIGARSDLAGIDLLDMLSPTFAPLVGYQTHVVSVEKDGKVRPTRFTVRGSGTITGGMVRITTDKSYPITFNVVLAIDPNPYNNTLLIQNCGPVPDCREFDWTLIIEGWYLDLQEVILEYTEVG